MVIGWDRPDKERKPMDILTSTVSILIGGGLFSLIQFLIQRHDGKHDKLKAVTDSINAMSGKMDERFNTLDRKIDSVDTKADNYNAVARRVRILRFEDELQAKQRHSKDSWDQVMSDIDVYENYCDTHPRFKNNQTAATITHIKHGYNERLEKRDFTY
jgi:hypothetical protein